MDYTVVTRSDGLESLARDIVSADVIGLDIETTALDPRHGEIRLVQLSLPGDDNDGDGRIFVIDLFQTRTLGPVLEAMEATKAIWVVHNCLTGCSRVLLSDGSSMLLRDMVRERHPGPVVTVNERTGELESKRVTGWIKRGPRAWDDWVRIRCAGKGELRATVDHKVLTERGWVRAGKLVPRDRVLSPLPTLSRAQESVLYGTLLGDGSISLQRGAKARAPYVSFSHCAAQREYARWKYELLGDLRGSWVEDTEPRFCGFAAENGTTQVLARTRSDPRLVEVRRVVLGSNGKRISEEWLSKLGPAEIAIWLADDGSHSGRGYGIRACVSAFSGRGSDVLVRWLRDRNWPAKQWWRKDGQEYITISGKGGRGPSAGIDRFWIEVAPYFPVSMIRKVPERYRSLVGLGWKHQPTSPNRWADEVLEVLPLARTEGVSGGWKRVGKGPSQYCLEVEGNHNFVANERVVSNSKFEQKWFWWHYRLRLWPLFCSFRASALIYNGRRGFRHNLDTVVERELHEQPTNIGEGKSDWSKSNLSQKQLDYAAEDVLRLRRLRLVLKKSLGTYGLLKTALIEFGVVLAEGRCELNGFPFNAEKWTEVAEANKIERFRLREELLYDLPHPRGELTLPGMSGNWNLDSPAQVLRSLQALGLRNKVEQDGKKVWVPINNTQEIELAQHAAKFPLVRKLLEYRGVAHRVKTYGFTFLRHAESDGRVHPDYYGLLVTGRYSANKSLQQIPRETIYRTCFEPRPGRRFCAADYSGVEMCLCAEISGDAALIDVFNRGEDAHYATAAIIMDKVVADVSKKERQQAKPVNFGLIYGMMPEKLVLYAMANYGVVMTLAQAKRYRDRYFKRYVGIASWHRRVLRDGAREGFARTLSGRIRYLNPDEAHNEFFNTPIQGSGADALKSALRLVQERLDKTFGISPPQTPDGPAQLVHHVHDEIITETDDDAEMIAETKRQLHDGMYEGMVPFLTKVPIGVDPADGANWSEIH